MLNFDAVSAACQGGHCVVSALSGLREVIIDAQTVLLNAAIQAGVPRFIPSDFSLDFTKTENGRNRNLDLRREFHLTLDKMSISATSVFNGAFADMLTGEIPMILFKKKRVLYWGKPDQRTEFTTVRDTANFTAFAALNPITPRHLRIAGNQVSPRDISKIMEEVTGSPFKLLRPGGAGLLSFIIRIAKTLAPGKRELYPAWQGMQYMRDMISGKAFMNHTDNDRYPAVKWTSIAEVVSASGHLNGVAK